MPMLLGSSARNDRRSRPVKLAVALGLALVAHLAAVGALVLLPAPDRVPRASKTPPRPVALRSIRADEWARNREEAPPAKALAEAKKQVEKKVEKERKGLVVATERGNGETAPDAKFQSEHSNRVEKETRSRDRSLRYVTPAERRTSPLPNDQKGQDDVPVVVRGGNGGIGTEEAVPPHGRTAGVVELPKMEHQTDVKLRRPTAPGGGGVQVAERPGSLEVRGNSDRLLIAPGLPGGEKRVARSQGTPGVPGLKTLIPRESALGEIFSAPASDVTSDVEEGDGTFLNTREWRYSSFYNRVKQSIAAHWRPGVKMRMRDPTGSIYGDKERQTLVMVTLDHSGELLETRVAMSSGLDFLDDEALQALQRAGRFPNPPAGLLSDGSTLRFGFLFTYGDSGWHRLRGFRTSD